MSIFPRKYHGPELKCGGPQMCPDCRSRVAEGRELGVDPWSLPTSWNNQEEIAPNSEILKKNPEIPIKKDGE